MGCVGIGLGASQAPSWPVHGRMLTMSESNNGLVLPYSALAVNGSAGAVAVVIVIFMAVTSTSSAQIVAVSSIVSSDLFHTYLHPKATEKQIIWVSRAACVGFALVAAAVSTALYYAGLSLTWTLYFLGVITCPGMVTISLTVLWNRQTKAAAILSPLIGLAAGIAVWISTAWYYGDGVIDVTTTGALIPCMWGNITSFAVPAILSPAISLIFPSEPFSWERFNSIKLISDDDASSVQEEKENRFVDTFTPEQESYMARMSKWAFGLGVFFFLAVWVLVPFGQYGAYTTFSKPFFRGWVVVSIIWLFATLLIVTFMPPIEGRHTLLALLTGKPRAEASAQNVHKRAEKGTILPDETSSDNEGAADQNATARASPVEEAEKKV